MDVKGNEFVESEVLDEVEQFSLLLDREIEKSLGIDVEKKQKYTDLKNRVGTDLRGDKSNASSSEEKKKQKKARLAELETERKLMQDLANEVYEDERKMAFAKLDSHFTALVGSKFRILPKSEPTKIQMAYEDALHYIGNIEISQDTYKVDEQAEELFCVSVKKKPFYDWIDSTERFARLVFDPSRLYGKNGDSWNIWPGWKYQPNKDSDCSLYLDHIRNNICQNNEAAYEWVLDWMAQIVQQPTTKTGKVLAIRGVQGSGKTVYAQMFLNLFDSAGTEIDKDTLTSNFNGSLMDKILVYADEAIWSGDRKAWGSLKKLITSDRMNITFKGKDTLNDVSNYIRLLITTNDKWSAPVEEGNRRYVSLTCGKDKVNNRKYFGQLIEQMKNGGYEKLMWVLLNRQIKDDWSETPVFDDSHIDNRIDTLSVENPAIKWLWMCIEEDTVDPLLNPIKSPRTYTTKELFGMYQDWVENTNQWNRNVSMDKFAKDISDIVPRTTKKVDGKASKVRDFWDTKTIIERIERVVGTL